MCIAVRKPFVLGIVCLLISSFSLAQNIRSAVSLTGSDLATCTVPDPCRTFDVALGKTNEGGEVIVLSSGGYGPFTVTTSVSIISSSAFHAAIAPTSGAAITVNAPGKTVTLRGLFLNSMGAGTGVSVNSAANVYIEDVVVNRFSGNGIEAIGASEVFVKDSEIRNCGASGIFGAPASGVLILTVDHTRMERNGWGLVVDSGVQTSVRDTVSARHQFNNFWFRSNGALAPVRASVENSQATDGLDHGFVAENGARVTIRNSAAVRNALDGFRAVGIAGTTTEMYLDHCLAAENFNGVRTGGAGNTVMTVSNSTLVHNSSDGIIALTNAVVRVYGNTVSNNAVGLSAFGGIIQSAGQNMVGGNGAANTIGTIDPLPPI